MSGVMEVAAARARLVAVLGEIAERAADGALERCPYRDREDVCGFPAGCQNQRRQGKTGVVLCSGGRLNPEPAVSNSSSNSSSNSAVGGAL